MNRFGLWLTIGILFSLPALVFAQDTGGCKVKPGSTGNKNLGKKATHERKVAGKKAGASKAPKITGTGNAPTVETKIGQKGKAPKQTASGKKNSPAPNPDKR